MTVRVILGRIVGRSRRRNPRPEELGSVTAEFAVAQWLTHTVETDDKDGATHAVSMLLDIQDDLRSSGELLGQEDTPPLMSGPQD